MKIGAFKTSLKEHENRVPIYPEHLRWLSSEVKKVLFLEKGYGESFGFGDEELQADCAGFLNRGEIFKECDILILPKPTEADLTKMRSGQILWGWVHCVQQFNIAQCAIDRKITVLAWEAMHHWMNGIKLLHVFYKNNEIAGYASVIQTLELLGLDGHYGPRKKVLIFSYGSVSRGAIYALQGRGFNNIHVLTRRETHLVADQNPDVYYYYLYKDGEGFSCRPPVGDSFSLEEFMADSDIIVNGILQNPNDPYIFIKNDHLNKLRKNAVIIDISCDKGMGFEFARPTTFSEPIITLKNYIKYYSVDHAPSYLWNAASREISKALIPYLVILCKNNFDIHSDMTLSKAIEIENGIIKNRDILLFQKREKEYPHKQL
ncbi:MAG: hypothetical protein WAW07_10940 [Bacteroidales bacterium]